jgi:hypothetical protein
MKPVVSIMTFPVRHFTTIASRQRLRRTLPSSSIPLLAARSKSTQPQHDHDDTKEYVKFPSSTNLPDQEVPVLLNAKEHAIGYLSKILNARVYEAAVETKLQYAHNLSTVRFYRGHHSWNRVTFF